MFGFTNALDLIIEHVCEHAASRSNRSPNMSVLREGQLFCLTSLSYRAECEITYVIKPNNSGGHDMVRPGHQPDCHNSTPSRRDRYQADQDVRNKDNDTSRTPQRSGSHSALNSCWWRRGSGCFRKKNFELSPQTGKSGPITPKTLKETPRRLREAESVLLNGHFTT